MIKLLYVELKNNSWFHTVTDRDMSDIYKDLNEHEFTLLGEEVIRTDIIERISMKNYL